MLYELLAHSDTVILDNEPEVLFIFRGTYIIRIELDTSAGIGIFDRVAE